MQSKAATVEEYLDELPEERKAAMNELRAIIRDNIPEGFEEKMSYGMIGYVVSRGLYPAGYHCDPKLNLPFINIGSQKNFVAMHHMGIYANEQLLKWFQEEYPKHVKTKLDMGKGCVRFKKMDQIPYQLIKELVTKVTAQQWIDTYESILKNRK